jgi:hypothetical protein
VEVAAPLEAADRLKSQLLIAFADQAKGAHPIYAQGRGVDCCEKEKCGEEKEMTEAGVAFEVPVR